MIKRQQASDKIAGSLSLACALHCLFMPSFLIVTSGFLSVSIDNELIHLVILLAALPVSIYALARGRPNIYTNAFPVVLEVSCNQIF